MIINTLFVTKQEKTIKIYTMNNINFSNKFNFYSVLKFIGDVLNLQY